MLELYHNDMSACAQKVRVTLAEKQLQWESYHLDLRAGDQQTPEYLKLNPRGVVPTLVDNGRVVRESTVIMEYLDDEYPEPRLRPADFYLRAQMRLWTKRLDEGPDAAYTPYLTRLDHLNLLAWIADRPKVASWYERIRVRPSYEAAMTKWENRSYVELMREKGAKAWPRIKTTIEAL